MVTDTDKPAAAVATATEPKAEEEPKKEEGEKEKEKEGGEAAAEPKAEEEPKKDEKKEEAEEKKEETEAEAEAAAPAEAKKEGNEEEEEEEEEEEDNEEKLAEEKRRVKYPNVASEVLCSEAWQIVEAMYENQECIRSIYCFLTADTPVSAAVSARCSKVAASLMQRKVTETIAVLKQIPGIVARFVDRIAQPGIVDLLIRLVSSDDDACAAVNWMCAEGLVEKLVDRITADVPTPSNTIPGVDEDDLHECLALTLTDMILVTSQNPASSCVVDKLQSEPISSKLLTYIFEKVTFYLSLSLSLKFTHFLIFIFWFY